MRPFLHTSWVMCVMDQDRGIMYGILEAEHDSPTDNAWHFCMAIRSIDFLHQDLMDGMK